MSAPNPNSPEVIEPETAETEGVFTIEDVSSISEPMRPESGIVPDIPDDEDLTERDRRPFSDPEA